MLVRNATPHVDTPCQCHRNATGRTQHPPRFTIAGATNRHTTSLATLLGACI